MVEVSRTTRLVNTPFPAERAILTALRIENPAYIDAIKHGRWAGNLSEYLDFAQHIPGGLEIPRGFTRQALNILHGHGIRPRIVDSRLALPELPLSFAGELRPYQQRAFQAAMARDHAVVCIPTGGGKTIVALAIIAARKQPALVLVHSLELLEQWRERIRQFLNIEAGQVGGGKFDVQPVTVAVINTARTKLDELQGMFGGVVVDECHRCPAAMFTEVVSGLDARFLLGLSATPFRRDGLGRVIFWHLGDLVHRVESAELEDIGAILKPEVIRRETSFQFNYADNYQEMITRLTECVIRNRQIVEDVAVNINCAGTALVVSDRVTHCNSLAGMIRKRGLTVEVLTGSTKPKERARIVEAVQAGRVQALISTVQLLGEGFDCTGLSDLYLTTPIKFKGRLIQVVGRILRPGPGKRARVFDYVDMNVGILRNQARKRWK